MPIEFKQESQPTGSSSDTARLSMMYDGSGRRISKTFLTKSATAASWDTVKMTHYTGIGTEVREEFHNGSRERVSVVVNMPQGLGRYKVADASQPADDNASRTFEWYLKNHLGSTMLVYGTVTSTDPNNADIGETKAAYDYRAFGEQIELRPHDLDKVTENFTGKERDDETKLNYFGARYLDAMLGLWVSVDPARQFSSPYLYAGNGVNPVNGVDPDGNEYWDDFNSPRAARDDFKKIYNTKSINENVEYATMFYETKRIGKDGKIASTYSYTKPNRGTIDRVVLDPKLPKDVYDKKHPGRIIEASYPLSNGDAHTHSRGDDGYDWANPSKMDMDNLTTEKGILFRPDGKVLEYDAKGNVNEIDK